MAGRDNAMNKSEHFPSVRLAVAGYASLSLLAWIGFVPGCVPPFLFRTSPVHAVPVVVTALVSLFILVILTPVVRHGPGRDRWLALLLAVFPFFTALWLGVWAILG
jgi:hypothetical protein